VAQQHGPDDVAAVGPQHAAVIVHHHAGGLLNGPVDQRRRGSPKQGILPVGTHRAHDVVPLVHGGRQPRNLFRRILQVRIQGDDDLAPDLLETGHDGGMLTVIAVEKDGDDFFRMVRGRRSSIAAERSLLPSSTRMISKGRRACRQAARQRRISSSRLVSSLKTGITTDIMFNSLIGQYLLDGIDHVVHIAQGHVREKGQRADAL
jgi:hypothetical protein